MKTKLHILLVASLFFYFTPLTFTSVFAQSGPGNVSGNLILWMRADKDVNFTGTNVNNWKDQSTFGVTATSSSNKPKYILNGLNFNPTIRFLRASDNFLSLGQPAHLNVRTGPGVPGRKDMTIFSVFTAPTNAGGTIITKGDSNIRQYQLWLGDTDRVVHYTFERNSSNDGRHWGRINALNEPKLTRGIVVSSGVTSVVNGVTDNLVVDFPLANASGIAADVLIGARRNSGNDNSGNQLTGDVSEIIFYDRALTEAEAVKVETYLAIKYGITLGYNDSFRDRFPLIVDPSTTTVTNFPYSGTSKDYIASNGNTLWNGSANAGFGYNVFGIARDDNSNLLQIKSKSANVQRLTDGTLINPIITMTSEAGGFSSNLSYLIVGNDGATVSLQTTTVPERMINTIGRKWKARESTNDVGTVKLDFDLIQFPLANEGQLQLIIADNTSFTNYKNYEGTYNAATQVLSFTGVNLKDNEYFTLGHVQELNSSYHFDFNGTSEYIEEQGVSLSGLSGSTLMAWVKLGASYGAEGLVLGQDNFNMRVTSTKVLRVQYNGINVNAASGFSLAEGVWTHIAAVYNGADPVKTVKLYINGIERGSVASLATLNVSTNNLISIGKSPTSSSLYFKGSIDEARVFNTALTEEQLRQTIYQEIQANGANTRGKIIPFNIGTTPTSTVIPWNRLLVYHNMSHIKGNCLIDKSVTPKIARIYGIPNASIKTQTAPMPFVTTQSGTLDTALNDPSNGVQGTDATTYDWSIVQIKHTGVSFSASQTHLGLLVDKQDATTNPITYTINGDTPLFVTWYLNLNGKIDLTGRSQLIQPLGSVLEPTSEGTLERDQQGTVDKYKYNYWSSPVGTPNNSTNNNTYTLNGVFKDGTNPASPQNINWTPALDGVPGPPIRISTRWTFKFENAGNSIANWVSIGSNIPVKAGQGFISKGSGAATARQNYTFVGKPHNGQIQFSTPGNMLNLLGNPYASALDGNAFITKNLAATDGTLYFWEHWGGGTHKLKDYEGGYATLNLVPGGVPAMSHPDVSQNGNSTISPGRYIPVGQGFFVIASPLGGTVTFDNDQRAFVKEDNGTSNIHFRANSRNDVSALGTQTQRFPENSGGESEEEKFTTIRFGHYTTTGFRRQILLGFMNEKATDGFDKGYDAYNIDEQPNDMYFVLGDDKLIIQGVGAFDEVKKIPLGVIVQSPGKIKFLFDGAENLEEDIPVFLLDKVTNIFYNLKENPAEIDIASSGTFNDRFVIQFTQKTLSNEDFESTEENLRVFHTQSNNTLNIFNNKPNLFIEQIQLFDLLGRSLDSFDVQNQNQTDLHIPLKNYAQGVYIVKMNLQDGQVISKKLIITQ